MGEAKGVGELSKWVVILGSYDKETKRVLNELKECVVL